MKSVIALAMLACLLGNECGAQPPVNPLKRLPRGAVARLGTLKLRSESQDELLAFSSDGKKLAMRDGERIKVWDFESRHVLFELAFDKHQKIGRPVKFEISPDNKHLILTSSNLTSRSSDEEFQLPKYQMNV